MVTILGEPAPARKKELLPRPSPPEIADNLNLL
jgi:hypothetical protein